MPIQPYQTPDSTSSTPSDSSCSCCDNAPCCCVPQCIISGLQSRYGHNKLNSIGLFLFDITKLIYSVGSAAIFASLTAENSKDLDSQLFYATCSFVLNFPMSWVFADEFINTVRNFSRFTTSYYIAGLFALFTAGMTTLAAYAIGQDAIYNSHFTWIKKTDIVGISFFTFNTLSTRFPGAISLLHQAVFHPLENALRFTGNRKRRTLQQLIQDVKNHPKKAQIAWKSLSDSPPSSSRLQIAADRFYKQRPKLEQASSCLTGIKKRLSHSAQTYTLRLICVALVTQTILLWLAKSSQGLNTVEQNWFDPNCSLPLSGTHNQTASHPCTFGDRNYLVLPAALANVFFYLVSAWRFSTTFPRAMNSAYRRANLFGTTGLLGIGVLAYFSGQGMGNEMRNLNGDFGHIGNMWYHSILKDITLPLNHLELLTTLCAGAVVNYNAFLAFSNTHLLKNNDTFIKFLNDKLYQSPDAITDEETDSIAALQHPRSNTNTPSPHTQYLDPSNSFA